jgi:hypothetical protein
LGVSEGGEALGLVLLLVLIVWVLCAAPLGLYEWDDCATALLCVCLFFISFERTSVPACLPEQASEGSILLSFFLYFSLHPRHRHRHQHQHQPHQRPKNTTLYDENNIKLRKRSGWKSVESEVVIQGFLFLTFLRVLLVVWPSTYDWKREPYELPGSGDRHERSSLCEETGELF